MHFAGVLLQRFVAYQAELVNGTIFTGTWTGVTDANGSPELRHADTGQRRTMPGPDGLVFFLRLADVQQAPRTNRLRCWCPSDCLCRRQDTPPCGCRQH